MELRGLNLFLFLFINRVFLSLQSKERKLLFLLNYFYKRLKFSSALPHPVNHSAGIWTLLSFIFVLINVLFFIKNK